MCSSSDCVLDRDRVYTPIVTSPKVPTDIYTTSVGLQPNDPADDVSKENIELHQMTKRSPAPNEVDQNLWDGYAILAILVLFWAWGIWIGLGRPNMGAVWRRLLKGILQRAQYWIGEIHQRFAIVGSFTDSVQGAWQWLFSRFKHKSQHTSKSDQDLPLSKHHQPGIETRLWPINLLYGFRGQDPHSFVQRATVLFVLFMVSAFCLLCWFFPRGYYALQVWAPVSSFISSAIYSITASLSQVKRCTKAAYYNPIHPDGSYVLLTTSSTFTGWVCRRIDAYIMFVRGISLGIWHGITSAIYSITTCLSQVKRCTKAAYYNPIHPDGSYILLTTPSTVTGWVCRQIDDCIMFVRSIPLLGIA